jgi:carboxyl-terminal processing protease
MAEPHARRNFGRRLPAILIGSAVLLALLAGFGAGFGYARSASPILEAQPSPTASPAGEDYALLYEIRGLIESEYLKPEDAERTRLLYGAARGMVQALGDPNSAYEPPQEREANDSRWTGRYEGVGMYVDQKDGQLVVTAPIEGGPAARAGIRPSDVVLEVDGQSIAGLSLTAQTLRVRGPKGSIVTLTIRREGIAEPLRIPVIREEIRLISARGRLLDNGLGLLRISQFTEGTLEETRKALGELLAAQPPGIILDLRGNAGGLLNPAVETAGLFLGGGPVAHQAHANGETRTYSAPDGAPLTELPMIILVDRGTASASEVLAAAMRDKGRADLIGERTYGKSTVQYIHRLSDGSGLRITVAQWQAPSGKPIPSTGLDPDWPMAIPNPPDPNRDPVLESASLRLLARIAAGPR